MDGDDGGNHDEETTNSGCIDGQRQEGQRQSNKDLTEEEKEAKRRLKKELKVQKRQRKLLVRLQHAIARKDLVVEAQARRELDQLGAIALLKTNQTSLIIQKEGEEEKRCRQMIAHLVRELLRLREGQKADQNHKAASLLRHMTKGTQTSSMFQSIEALWGYTRQKFHQRAVLVFTSFAKLKRPQHQYDNELRLSLWKQLVSIKTVCSVGSGPGCDAVGAGIFIKHFAAHKLKKALLVDFAIHQWNTVLHTVSSVTVPSLIEQMILAPCDVTLPLQSQTNQKFQTLLEAEMIDLFLFSYILTETRGRWLTFMGELIQKAKSGALFYFSEPKPWQLHIIRKEFPSSLQYVWLDSSMDQPEMQPLENRLTPGILLARKP